MVKRKQVDEIFDYKLFFLKIVNNWYYLLLCLVISFTIAFGVNRYSKEVFKASTTILVKEKTSVATSAAEMLYSNSFRENKTGLKDEIHILRSFPLIYETVQEIGFDISYFIVGNIKTSETFDDLPFKIINNSNTSILAGESIFLEILDENSFRILDGENVKEGTYLFNEEIIIKSVPIKIVLTSNNLTSKSPKFLIEFHNLSSVVKKYKKNLVVKQLERESDILKLSIYDSDQRKAVTFLNKLTENYIEKQIEDKNIASKSTIDFINKQLLEMKDSLSLIELSIQDYKKKHEITDISLKAQNFYSKLSELENEQSKYMLKEQYYNYLIETIENKENLENIISPSIYGILDVTLEDLTNQLISLQIQKEVIKEEGQTKNPVLSRFSSNINQLIVKIKESVKSSMKANGRLINDVNNRIRLVESSLGVLPQEERELMSIQRLHDISEKMYMFLLQKRAEAGISKSSNTADSKIVEPAFYSNKPPVYPSKSKNYLIALISGFLFHLGFLFLKEILNDKIITRFDLDKITSIPVLGIIGTNHSPNSIISKLGPKSPTVEGFRVLRSNLNSLYKKHEKKVFAVTSSISGEGKTFIAANLAIIYAKSGKKCLILGADLRKPKLYKELDLSNKIGLSSYLSSDYNSSEIITKTDIENLDVISSGPIPPDPAELLVNDKFNVLMKELKELYDIIIIDCPPIGLVVDALVIMEHIDISLYIVRQNYTNKGLLSYVNDLNEKEQVRDIQIIINDVKAGSGVYGYSNYSYGYG